MQIDHVGIATANAAAVTDTYVNLFDSKVVHEETIENLTVRFISLDNGYFELLEPTEDEEVITSFLEQHGPGLHHVGVATNDIRQALDTAISNEIECIDKTPRTGARGHSVAFLHPKSTGGVLFEFVEHTTD